MANQIPLINGKAYDYASVRVQFLGITLYGITAVNYGATKEKVNNYGAGSSPVSRGYGNKEFTASLTLSMTEVRRILSALPPTLDLTDIPPFPIIVQYQVGARIVTDTVLNAEFTQIEVDTEDGDTDIDMEMPLVIAGINWGR